MKLSKKAIKDLRKVLSKDCGKEYVKKNFNDEEINRIGNLLLTILKESLKMKVNE